MKPVFKCDYCSFMGTEQEVKEHESKCTDNYDKRSCYTCKYKKFKSMTQFECTNGIEIPEGQIYEFCSQYERKEKSSLVDLFGGIFGSSL